MGRRTADGGKSKNNMSTPQWGGHNTFPSNERKPSVWTAEKAKIICPPPSGMDIISVEHGKMET